MNDIKQPEKVNEVKLEWLEPTFEVLLEPEKDLDTIETGFNNFGPS
jgi:hypothetical protein